MELKNYRYVKQDALSFLKELPDNSVKLIVTSPPYNIGKEYEVATSLTTYLDNLKPIIREIHRVLTEDGSVCWEIGNYIDPNTSEVYPLDIYYYSIFKDLGMQLRNRIIWHFGHGLQCEKRFSGRYETILWFTKSDSYTFNLDDVRIPSKYPGKRAYKGANKGKLSGNPKGKNPEDLWVATIDRLYDDWDSCVWDVPNVKSQHPEKTIHPCQFPIELVERCVLALTNENDVVYDPFAGVGSALIAALKNNRQALGTELVEDYIVIGEERIQKLKQDILKTRPIYQRIYEPSGSDKISTYPLEWLEERLQQLLQTQTSLQQEIENIQEDILSRTQS
ncbi:MAG: site-specific DNA-methyltransferase [Clostridiales bacterium]|nr:site-specific DNA-methyltransferase [Clostridiales bacterium]